MTTSMPSTSTTDASATQGRGHLLSGRRQRYIVIAGCGRLGSVLATELSSQGNSVVVIDIDESRLNALPSEFSGFRVVGNATEQEILRSARLNQADCFLAATNRDNINLMLAQVARQVFNVDLVIARIFDPTREPIYRQLGVQTICPTTLSSAAFLGMIQANIE